MKAQSTVNKSKNKVQLEKSNFLYGVRYVLKKYVRRCLLTDSRNVFHQSEYLSRIIKTAQSKHDVVVAPACLSGVSS